jgi:hypothetical protein
MDPNPYSDPDPDAVPDLDAVPNPVIFASDHQDVIKKVFLLITF